MKRILFFLLFISAASGWAPKIHRMNMKACAITDAWEIHQKKAHGGEMGFPCKTCQHYYEKSIRHMEKMKAYKP
jgi:hypothetical protein